MLKWASIIVVASLVILAPLIGLFSQNWAMWWFQGSTLAPPGTVPDVAIQVPQGPLLSDSSPLLAAIQPWMGSPYVFGGNGPPGHGVDCSGFTVAVFRQLGYNLPRTAQQQFNATQRVSQPEFGDLVFFQGTYQSPDRITHVGIIVAPGVMVSAIEPTLGRQLLANAFWSAHFAGYGRVLR